MDWQARGLPPRNHQVLLGLLQRAGTAGGRWPAVACLPLAGVPGLLSMVLQARWLQGAGAAGERGCWHRARAVCECCQGLSVPPASSSRGMCVDWIDGVRPPYVGPIRQELHPGG